MRSELLCGDLYLFVQEFRGEVGAVRPAYGVQFGVQDELFEIRGLAKRLKYLSAEFTAQVYVAFGSIVETQMNRKLTNMMCFNKSWRHNTYSNGAIF